MREPVQIEDVNWEPLSDVRTAGPPNLDIQVEMIEPSCGSNQKWWEDKNNFDWRVEDQQYQYEHEKISGLELE